MATVVGTRLEGEIFLIVHHANKDPGGAIIQHRERYTRPF